MAHRVGLTENALDVSLSSERMMPGLSIIVSTTMRMAGYRRRKNENSITPSP
jgi:hypothetical protein